MIVFSTILLTTISFIVYTLLIVNHLNNESNRLINVYYERQAQVAKAETILYKYRLSNYTRYGSVYAPGIDPIGLEYKLTEFEKDFNECIDLIYKSFTEDEWFTEESILKIHDLISKIKDKTQEYIDACEPFEQAYIEEDKVTLENVLANASPIGIELNIQISELNDYTIENANEAAIRVLEEARWSNNIILIISIVIIILTIILMTFAIRNMEKPVTKLKNAVIQIANGNLSYPIRSDRKDEIGILANCVANMVNELIQRNQMGAILDNLDSMICVTTLDYKLLFINKLAAEVYSIKREECIDKICYNVLRDRKTPCEFCSLKELSKSRERKPYKSFENVWNDNLKIWVSGSDSIINWIDGSRVFFTSVRDTSLRKKQEDELFEAKKIAEFTSASKSSFLANMSHEIRTPLNAIIGITEILLRDETLHHEIREPLLKMHSSGDLLLCIINDILDLFKIESGKMEISPQKYELASTINDVVALNIIRIGGKRIDFELTVDPKLPRSLFGDDLKIKQVLNNLLSNAFKYTDEGKVKLTITFERNIDKNNIMDLIFVVSDTGQGMTIEQVEHLFDEYVRFNKTANRTTEGTGLGMSITKNLIDLMEGEIHVKSELNWGSVFTVTVPQIIIDDTQIGVELANSLASFRPNELNAIHKAQVIIEPMPYGKVLIVDDVESNLYVAEGLLAPYMLQIETVMSGFEAIDNIKKGKIYDIIFMDHMMPKMDGMETVSIIRKLGYTYPIVALTVNALAGQAAVFLNNGFDGYVSKPIDIRQLNGELRKFIRDRHQDESMTTNAKPYKMIEQNLEIDPQLLRLFVKDANKSLQVIEEVFKNNFSNEDDWKSFVICVHSMKSALFNINEKVLSKKASELEQAGNRKDSEYINSNISILVDSIKDIIVKSKIEQVYFDDDELCVDYEYLREELIKIIKACDNLDKKTIKVLLAEINKKLWESEILNLLGLISDDILSGDYDIAINRASSILKIIESKKSDEEN